MAKNKKHESKHNVQTEDKIEISAEGTRACKEEIEKLKCNTSIAESEATQSDVSSAKDVKDEEARNLSQNESASDKPSSDELPSVEPSDADLCKEVEKWKNEYLRKAADFENYRKRMIKEKKDAIDYANESILQDLVTVLDDFDRGIDAVEKYATDAIKPYMQGFMMIRSSLYSMLENKYALKYYKSEGEAFDPNIHEAKASRESEDVEVEMVEKELLKGYKLHERVIRVAQVETVKPKK